MQQDDKIFLYEQFQQYAVQEAMASSMEQFQQLVTKYGCAIKEVRTKFEVLNEELSIKSKRNPIHAIKSRIKNPKSIIDKLQRREIEDKKNAELTLT